MRKFVSLLVASTALAGLASACSMEAPTDEDLGMTEAATCSNQQGTNAMIAALAVAVGRELGRWKVGTDFKLVTGTYNQQHLALSTAGLARCTNGCPNVKALLTFQDARYDLQISFPGGEKLSSWSYAARLVAGYNEQLVCEKRPGSQGNNCPAEEHKLTLAGTSPGACDTNYTFNATNLAGGNLAQPQLLKNKLLWAGQYNPYIAFQSTASTVTIDPTWGLGEGDGSQSGSCWENFCNKYSTTSLLGQCCSCNGNTFTFKSSGAPTVFLCK
jgi:hypothetical protein